MSYCISASGTIMQTRKWQITLRETIVQVSSLSLNHSRLLEALSIGRMKEVLINRLFAYCISTFTPPIYLYLWKPLVPSHKSEWISDTRSLGGSSPVIVSISKSRPLMQRVRGIKPSPTNENQHDILQDSIETQNPTTRKHTRFQLLKNSCFLSSFLSSLLLLSHLISVYSYPSLLSQGLNCAVCSLAVCCPSLIWISRLRVTRTRTRAKTRNARAEVLLHRSNKQNSPVLF